MTNARLKHLLLTAAYAFEDHRVSMIAKLDGGQVIKTFEEDHELQEVMAYAIRYWVADAPMFQVET